jgi:hypothetical protein
VTQQPGVIIAQVRPTVGTGERQGYAVAMTGLWSELSRPLSRLESVAALPAEELDDEEVLESLAVLQYALHTAGELALGIEPPAEAEWAHRELAAALSDARDATAEITEAASSDGAEATFALVPEWRGALFRVRLAQMRLAQMPPPAPRPASEPPSTHDRAALVATALVLAGTFVVTCGAVLGLWQLWAAGLVLVAGGFIAYRP